MTDLPSLIDALRLARTENVGPLTFRKLLVRYGSAAAAIDALPGLTRQGGRAAPLRVPAATQVKREADAVLKRGGRLLIVDTPDYPKLLGLIPDAPPILAVLGRPEALAGRAVAIVGARNASSNGQAIAERMGADLARAGLVVVSGLARGIDAAAHRGALSHGLTVAAVAGGLDVAYPPENAALQEQIGREGAVVAEAPFGTAPQSRHFPRRNRIIAGLALGVVLIEASPNSGSLITAGLAQDYSRELFAVPGSPLDPRSRGANRLIREGAHLTESANDVLDNLPDHPGREGLTRLPHFRGARVETLSEPPQLFADAAAGGDESPAERQRLQQQVVDLLCHSPTSVDDLVRRCQMSPASVIAALLELELAGRVETLPGNKVALLAGS